MSEFNNKNDNESDSDEEIQESDKTPVTIGKENNFKII